jgi:hypothetical protein
MRALQFLVLVLLVTASRADGIPPYPYFYTCASEVIDCSNFPQQVVNSQGEEVGDDAGVAYYRSSDGQITQLGETYYAIGIADSGVYLFNEIGGDAVVGFGAVRLGLTAPNVDTDALNAEFGITCPSPLVPGCPAGDAFSLTGITGIGIHNADQLLVNLQIGIGPVESVEGVLSPTAVPEPSALLLLAAVIGLSIPSLTAKTRQSPRSQRQG